jgi:cyclopropane fatty-acyl-phospholipid synthase-like methyltransferase
MEPCEIVATGYDHAAAAYAHLENPETPWPRMSWLDELLRQLDPGSRVLDLGCASGVPVAVRIAQHHHVTGVDLSVTQIEEAQRKVTEGTFPCADILKVDFPPQHFDAVVSFYTFDHIPREEHPALLAQIYQWLRSEGLLLISVEDGDQPGTVAEWLGVPMYFSHFDAENTKRLVKEAGFSIERTEVVVQVEQRQDIPYLFLQGRKL